MPWFPEFASGMELARRQNRATAQSDPVGQYVAALGNGDAHALETLWPGEVVVHDPRWGEVRGRKKLREFVRYSRSWLAEHRARTETVAATCADGRAVVELLVHLSYDGQELAWPVAVVADSPDDRSVVFRSYFSQRAVDGQYHLRPAFLQPGAGRPRDVVGRYQAALAAGDAQAAAGAFEPDGYYREPAGPPLVHRGTEELTAFFASRFSAGGGIGLRTCAATDDGVRCALEYNCVRWGSRDLPPQAGIGVFERGPGGLLAAARIYDDIEPPGAFPMQGRITVPVSGR
jgi:ketosteroid isomerase-like protein